MIVIQRSIAFNNAQLAEYIGIENGISGKIGQFEVAEVNVTSQKILKENDNPIPSSE